ncbi:MAG: Rieske 2Fe-2S domain-containing protein, partial [Steroidobacteraceae bacterium]
VKSEQWLNAFRALGVRLMTTHVPHDLRKGLRNYWYPVLLSSDLPADKPVPMVRLGERLVAWRDANGAAAVFADACPHRRAQLSKGDITNGRLQCRYHGLQFSRDGQCRLVPTEGIEDGAVAQRLSAVSYPTAEYGGVVFSYIGDTEVFPPPSFEPEPELDKSKWTFIVETFDWPANWLLVRDNTPDSAHLPFVHGHLAARSSAAGKLTLEVLPGAQNPAMKPEYVLGFLEKALTVTASPRGGMLVQRDGESIAEVEWVPPALAKIWIDFAGKKVRQLQFEVPIDEYRTRIFCVVGIEASNDAPAEAQMAFMRNVLWPTFRQTFDEDSGILGSQGDVEDVREAEHLIPSDFPMIQMRRRIRRIHEEQLQRIASARSQSAAPRG